MKIGNPVTATGELAAFQRRMEGIVPRLGLTATTRTRALWILSIPCEGLRYEMIVCHRDDLGVLLVALSSIKYPLKQLPRAMFGVLDRLNAQMRTCEFGPFDEPNRSCFCVKSKVPVADLTPDLFENAIRELVPRAAALDQILAEEGFAR